LIQLSWVIFFFGCSKAIFICYFLIAAIVEVTSFADKLNIQARFQISFFRDADIPSELHSFLFKLRFLLLFSTAITAFSLAAIRTAFTGFQWLFLHWTDHDVVAVAQINLIQDIT